jgi:hypothetical protein
MFSFDVYLTGRKSWHHNGQTPDDPSQQDHPRQQPQGRVQTWNVPGIKIDVRANFFSIIELLEEIFLSTKKKEREIGSNVIISQQRKQKNWENKIF